MLLESGVVKVVLVVIMAVVEAAVAVRTYAVEHGVAYCGRGDGCCLDVGAHGDDCAHGEDGDAGASAAASAAAQLHVPFAGQAAALATAQVQPQLQQPQPDPHGVEAEVLAEKMGLAFENELMASCAAYPKMVEERHSGK